MQYQEIKKLLIDNNLFDEVKTLFKRNGGATVNEISALLHVKARLKEDYARTIAANSINNYTAYFKAEK